MPKEKIIGFPQKPRGLGGPSSFQLRFQNELVKRGWKIVYPEDNGVPDIIMVVGSTSKIVWLLRMKRKGAKVLHRLDGMTWRIFVKYAGVKSTIMGSITNVLVNTIRSYIADYIVYQSIFARDWWLRKRGQSKADSTIIYNGTSLDVFVPTLRQQDDVVKLLCAEGTLEPDPFIVDLLKKIASAKPNGKSTEITILGKTNKAFDDTFKDYSNVVVVGHVPKDKVVSYHKKTDIFLSIEINPACPNAIVEALASGMPVIGFDSGAVAELVTPKEGVILPYKNNPWKLQWPSMEGVVPAIEKIDSNYLEYHTSAITRAKTELNAEMMTDKYIEIIDKIIEK